MATKKTGNITSKAKPRKAKPLSRPKKKSIGRPKMKLTAQQKTARKRESAKRWYAKNKKSILLKKSTSKHRTKLGKLFSRSK